MLKPYYTATISSDVFADYIILPGLPTRPDLLLNLTSEYTSARYHSKIFQMYSLFLPKKMGDT